MDSQSEAVGKPVHPIPDKNGVNKLYTMYLRIGGLNELPSESKPIDAFLKDFWLYLYFENRYIPVDIPFDVLMHEFTKSLIHGDAQRKGNNQAEICRAMNNWVQNPDVRAKLYQVRDRFYPSQKPKQIEKKSKPSKSGTYYERQTNKEILQMYEKIKMLYSNEKIAKCLNEFGAKSEVAKVVNEYKKRFPDECDEEQKQKKEANNG